MTTCIEGAGFARFRGKRERTGKVARVETLTRGTEAAVDVAPIAGRDVGVEARSPQRVLARSRANPSQPLSSPNLHACFQNAVAFTGSASMCSPNSSAFASWMYAAA